MPNAASVRGTSEDRLRQADVLLLRQSAHELNTAPVDRLVESDAHSKLLSEHHAMVSALAHNGQAGVYSFSPERLRQFRHQVLTRETAGLFPGKLADAAALQKEAASVVDKARANQLAFKAGHAITFEKFSGVAQSILGVNTGADEIVEASVHPIPGFVLFDAFDRAGFHVIQGGVSVHHDALYIELLQATHGRNVEDLAGYGKGEEKMPGRGNARAVSEALSAAMSSALANGLCALECTPGSDEVARLYGKMGFRRSDGNSVPLNGYKMRLDLTDAAVVTQMVLVFTASRIGIRDVPKDVGAKIFARGQARSPPNRLTFPPFEREEPHLSFLLSRP